MIKNYFTHFNLNRNSLIRDNNLLRSKFIQNNKLKFIIFHDDEILINTLNKDKYWIEKKYFTKMFLDTSTGIFLGNLEKTCYYAVEIEQKDLLNSMKNFKHYYFTNLRQATKNLNKYQSSILAYAQSLIFWNKNNLYCGLCGNRMLTSDSGHSKTCSSKLCEKKIFPRIDPAIITLITHKNFCLLARQKSWPNKLFSTLAGFVEYGESIEEAVKRETIEEVGLKITNVVYQHSQPWPFPYTLMLGFKATSTSSELAINYKELEDAQWFSKKEIINLTKKKELKLPGKISIAFKLIEQWLNN